MQDSRTTEMIFDEIAPKVGLGGPEAKVMPMIVHS